MQLGNASDPTNQLPTSLTPNFDGGRPHSHREAPLLIYSFIRVAQVAGQCKHIHAANPFTYNT